MTTQNPDLSPLLRLLHEDGVAPVTTSPGHGSTSPGSAGPGSTGPGSTGPGSAGPSAPTKAAAGPHATGTRRSMRFQPGLEGLRGLAVAGVLVFHGGFEWATGGFLGVSTFFTLSGFLITTLLLLEHQSTGTISLRKFWGRRFRRLMPASLLLLVGVVLLFAPFVASSSQLDSLPGDVYSALAYIANWHFIFTGQSYEQLFSAPSPLLHFWSLAIEEQFYVVFPLLITFLVARWAVRRNALAWILGGLAVASTAEMALLYTPGDTSRVYYGTDTRAAELLLGAVLAVVLVDRGLLPRTLRSICIAAGGAALVVVLWLWHAAGQTDSWLYRGGFAAYTLCSCAVIVAATQPGLVKNVLATPVLRWLGRISYGAYLIHWPVFLWLDQALPDGNRYVAFAAKLAVTFVLAELSLRLLETPVREKKVFTQWQPLVAAPLAIALIVGATVVVTSQPRDLSNEISFSGAPAAPSDALTAADAPTTTTTLLEPGSAIDPPPPMPALLPHATGLDLHVMLEGDSGIFTLGGFPPYGLMGWAEDTQLMRVSNYGKLGCGIARGGMQVYRGVTEPAGADCANWEDRFGFDLDGINPKTGEPIPRATTPQVVVAMVGTWDVLDRKLAGHDDWIAIGDPAYDAFFARELSLAMDELTSRGSVVIWMTHPQIRTGIKEKLPGVQPESDPRRMQRLNQIVEEVAETRPHVRVIDLAGHMADRPQGELDLTERDDGIHWTNEASRNLADWLGPQIVETYDAAWNEITAAQSADTSSSTATGGG